MRTTKSNRTPSKFTPKRTGPQKDADMVLIAGLALKGCTEQGIADALNSRNPYTLSRSQVHADIVTLRRHWSQAAAADTNELLGEELQKLNQLERTSWQAFDTTHEAIWLGTILKTITARIGLLGLARPVMMQFTGPDGGPIAVLEVPERQKIDRNA